jgi:hypothetical protein
LLHNCDFELLSPLLCCCTEAAPANCFSGVPQYELAFLLNLMTSSLRLLDAGRK